ncbi:hypothetical protein CspeluHIS016_0403150 [Cutaneotrichosporon spelunceum]|uniref:TM7S3/TM198-like domain-containing protein n=1 Tax=Cutaneotrichosporon spelunceum TaxID=1672016 RepID=A0AAD3TVT5_9TREE|nr:hypothetical protein CspeluHIS016_0403150 [Cutaneotrichosporon spelunceum]
MHLPFALTRVALVATLVGHALAQDPLGGNGGGESGGNQPNGSPTPAPSPSPSGGLDNGGNNTASAVSGGNSLSATSPISLVAAGEVMTTTITSFIAGPSGSQPAVFTFTFTMGMNGTVPSGLNSTAANSTIDGNSTISNETIPWNDTLSYLPFSPKLDAAYGIGGALLILTGIPVATLGGKNRWSALAIVSGYTVAFFCLVIILSFGVTPALEPPSPKPPSDAMRGLYLLAMGIACIVGAGLGIFFFTFAKYWVGAVGGFCFGWFLLALRKGGLVRNTGPRWAILGSLTLTALVLAFIPKVHEYVLLVASALIGATAFTLGVDCFTRAGLKEFYIYNLGYQHLFPSLNGGKYPLTQSMQVEIGVVAAATLIASLIQFKVVNVLAKRREQIVQDEEARREAGEVARAAENFKNVDAELAEWEGKHGGGGNDSSILTPPPQMGNLPGFDESQNSGSNSTLVQRTAQKEQQPIAPELLVNPRRMSLLEEMGYRDEETPPTPHTPTLLVNDTDPEIEQKMLLLAEVRRQRQDIQSSMGTLRSSHYETKPPGDTGSMSSQGSRPGTSVMDRGRGATTSQPSSLHSRANSMSSQQLLDGVRQRKDSNASSRLLDDRPRSRHLSVASSRLLSDDEYYRRDSRSHGNSLDELRASRTFLPGEYSATELGSGLSLADNPGRPADGVRVGNIEPLETTPTVSDWQRRNAEWEDYLKTRNVQGAAPPGPALDNDMTIVSTSVARAISQRNEGVPRTADRTPGQEYGANLMRALSMDLHRASTFQAPVASRPARNERAPRTAPRAMTTDELAERHRDKLSKLQDKVTAPIREQIAIANARDEWSKAQARERDDQARRERERAEGARPPKHELGDAAKERSVGDVLTSRAPTRPADRRRRTEEWRNSVPLSPPKTVVKPSITASASQPLPQSHSHQMAKASASQTLPHSHSYQMAPSPPAAQATLPHERRASRRSSNMNIA